MKDKISAYVWLFMLGLICVLFFYYFINSSKPIKFDNADLYQSPPNNAYYEVPDFTKWPIEKEGNIDADSDGKDDFKLVYYLKNKEDAVALFVPLENVRPRLLMFAHYPENYPTGEDIFYGVYENNKWNIISFPYLDQRIANELKNLHIRTEPILLAIQAFRSNFNRRGAFFLGVKCCL